MMRHGLTNPCLQTRGGRQHLAPFATPICVFHVAAMHPKSVEILSCRRVEAVNISPFIANLPFGKDTTNFGTPDASGSTSQV